MTVLAVDHVSKEYGSSGGSVTTALADISLSVAAGECLAVIGESGSGKSTLARLVMGLESPTSGTIRVAGADPATTPRSQRATGSAIVLQDPTDALDPRMEIGAIVAEPLRNSRPRLSRAAIRARVTEALEQVGLDGSFLHRRPNQLSGGQQQRVGIARALVRDPAFLVLDEPTSALDPSVQAQVMRLIEDLRKRLGIASLLITHDLAVATYLADRIVVLRHGIIVEEGPSSEIWANPRHPYTVALLEAASYAPVANDHDLEIDDSSQFACAFADVCGPARASACPGISVYGRVTVSDGHSVLESCAAHATATPGSTTSSPRPDPHSVR